MHHSFVYLSNRLALAALFLTEVAVAAPSSPLAGTWATPFRSRLGGISVQQSVTEKDGIFKQEARVHVKIPLFGNLAELYTAHFTSTLQGPIDASKNIYALDLTFVKMEQTPLNEETVVKNNGDAQCGFTDWQVGVPKDITGIHCDEHDIKPQVGAKGYTIVQIQEDRVLFGKDAGDTPETRSTELDTTDVYTKVEDSFKAAAPTP